MLARSGGTLCDMLYWYNNSLNATGIEPFEQLHKYNPLRPNVTGSKNRVISLNPYKVGDKVYVKPGQVKCTSV